MRDWPWKISVSADRATLWPAAREAGGPGGAGGLVDAAVRHHHADAFLSGPTPHRQAPGHPPTPDHAPQDGPSPGQRNAPPTLPSQRHWVVGVEPAAELRVDDHTTRDDLRRFAFQGPGPAAGFLSYALPLGAAAAARRDPAFPLGLLRRYHALLEWAPHTQELTICADDPALGEHLLALTRRLPSPSPASPPRPAAGRPPVPRDTAPSSASRRAYVDAVEAALEAIRQGRVYQLNLSLRFETPFPPRDAWPLFQHLFETAPASHYAWVDTGRYKLLSTSPERFLRVEAGTVLTQPIKGTAHVPAYPHEAAARAALLASHKEAAELSMIVDLLRNDLARSCAHGTVAVPRHRAVFRVDDLLHSYSDVTGTLRPDRDVLDLLLDAFPGGSVTGCPKTTAVALIDQLEGHPRDAYCGAFVLLRGPRDMESSIAIRTAVLDTQTAGGTLRFDAGSGIVAASDPAAEYAETLAKAHKFHKALHPNPPPEGPP